MSMNSEGYKPLVGITLGDPAGVGPEIVVKALSSKHVSKCCRPLVIGDLLSVKETINLVRGRVEAQGIKDPKDGNYEAGVINVIDLKNIDRARLAYGKADKMSGQASLEFIDKAIDLALQGEVDAIVTAPINKESIHLAGCRFPGHTEIFADRTHVKEYSSMIAVGSFRVMHVTLHTSLREAVRDISEHGILKSIRLAHNSLLELGINNPRIAVPGLNPHSGDNGLFGDEEQKIITPAIQRARLEGLNVDGPVSPDTVFIKARGGKYDVVIALYHDQGHIPAKLIGWEWSEAMDQWTKMRGVSIVLGLPLIRTNPDHGTAYDIAGKGIANPEAIIEAINLAVLLFHGRKSAYKTSA
jgi:4-hydroxythreonine-4-phosphate dehydrogenase